MSARRRLAAEIIFVIMVLAVGALYLGQPARQQSLLNLQQEWITLKYWLETSQVLVEPFDWSTIQLGALARFGDEFEFLGCDFAVTRENGKVRVWQLTIWRALKRVARDYTLYTHFVDPDAGQPSFAQADHVLGQQFWDEMKPTSQWQPGEIVVDAVELPETLYRNPNAQVRVGVWLPEEELRLQPRTDSLQVDEYGRLVICR